MYKQIKIIIGASLLAITTCTHAFESIQSKDSRLSPEQRQSMRSDMRQYNQDRDDGYGHPNIRPEHLEKLKAMDLERHRRHIQMIQKGMECIQRSTTPDQYKSCKHEERQAREQEKQHMKETMQNLKQERKQNKD